MDMIRYFWNYGSMNSEAAVTALRALSQTHRLAAFRALVQAGPAGLSVGELRVQLQLAPATLSAHLNQLRAAGLVVDRRDGRTIQVSAQFAQMNALLAYLTDQCCAGRPQDCANAMANPACEPVPAATPHPLQTRSEP